MNRVFLSFLLLSTVFLAPINALAQTTSDPCAGMTGTSLTNCRNIQASASVQQRFNPNATLTSSNRTFSGISFSGVGGAIAGCTNIGSGISGGIQSIGNVFKSKTPTVGNTPLPSSQGNANAIGQSQTSGASSPAATLPGTRDLSTPSTGISNTSNSIGGTLGSAASQQVPVVSAKTDAELKKANQREQCLNGVAYAVAKGLLKQVTEKTLNWVSTGFNGNPLYIRDLNSFLRTVSDERVSLFLNQIQTNDPVFGNAIRSIATEQLSGIQDGLLTGAMNTPQARAYEAFQEDFTNGGWQAFLNPKNNSIESIFNAADDLNSDLAKQDDKVRTQLENGGGFLDLQRCVEYADDAKTKYPYSYKEYSCQTNIQADADAYYRNCLTSQSAQACRSLTDTTFNPTTLISCIPKVQASAKVNDPKQCVRYETVTPGSIIQAQVAQVTTSPTRQLEQADQINEVLGSFFDQLLNRLLSEGLSSLRGRSSTGLPVFGGVGSNVVIGTNNTALSSVQSGASAFGYQQSGSGYNDDFDVSRPQHTRAVLQAQYDYLSAMLDARAALNRIVPTLGALDYCIPGPNPTWKEGLNDNAVSFFGSLQEVQKDSTLFGRLLQRIPIFGGLFGNGEPHAIAAVDISLFDKVTGTPFTSAKSIVFRERNRSTATIFENVERRWNELMASYETNFTQSTVTNAFISVDSGNAPYVQGFVDSAFKETAQLPAYTAAAFEIDAYYETSETSAREATARLEAIRNEANSIVATAKARHIAAQAAAGTPVNRACLDSAYNLDATPVVGRARQESSAPSPLFNQFIEANNYFYTNL